MQYSAISDQPGLLSMLILLIMERANGVRLRSTLWVPAGGGIDKAHYTENAQVQKKLLLTVGIPPHSRKFFQSRLLDPLIC